LALYLLFWSAILIQVIRVKPKDDDNIVNRQLNEMQKEESSGVRGNFSSSYNNYDKESIFFKVFEELSKDNGNGLIGYEKLRLRLISTGKFFAGDAVLIIEHMVRNKNSGNKFPALS
jgi:hypothetical protein